MRAIQNLDYVNGISSYYDHKTGKFVAFEDYWCKNEFEAQPAYQLGKQLRTIINAVGSEIAACTTSYASKFLAFGHSIYDAIAPTHNNNNGSVNSLPSFEKLSVFQLHENKKEGYSAGKIYIDSTNQKWLIKTAQYPNEPLFAFKEYITSGILQHLLGEKYAPTVKLILDDNVQFWTHFSNKDIYKIHVLIGSKFLDNFQSLSSINKIHFLNSIDTPLFQFQKNKLLLNMSQNKKSDYTMTHQYLKIVYASVLVKDSDAHNWGNIGIIREEDNTVSFARVDASFGLDHSPYFPTNIKDDINTFVTKHFNFISNISNSDLDKFSTELNEIEKIVNLDLLPLIDIVNEKCDDIKEYVDHFNTFRKLHDQPAITLNIYDLRNEAIKILKNSHQEFINLFNELTNL